MELGIAGQDAWLALARQAGEQTVDEFMGVVGRDEPVDPRQIEMPRHALRQLLPDRPQHLLPFAVDEAGGIVPGAQMRLAGRIRPEVMAVGGEMQAGRPVLAEARELGREVEGRAAERCRNLRHLVHHQAPPPCRSDKIL
jgi:hypothetical protein